MSRNTGSKNDSAVEATSHSSWEPKDSGSKTRSDPGRGIGEMGFEDQDSAAPLDVGESPAANETSPDETQGESQEATNEQSRG